jgi:hypothetical protein
MKLSALSLLLLSSLLSFAQENAKTQNIILVTWDGFRWQELFEGADKKIISKKKYVEDRDALKKNFWADNAKERREKLVPFFWNIVAKEGVLIGNRKLNSKMEVTNRYHFSYPGYNEIFSGYGDKKINSNNYPDNPSYTIFDCLQGNDGFKSKCAAFATWDAFPRIINAKRNATPVYVNYKSEGAATVCNDITITEWGVSVPSCNQFVKTDTMTYRFAKEYLQKNHPRFAFIGFDETDGFAHEGRYDAYLNSAHQLDRYLQDLWNFIQSDEHYRDNTTLIITCDHGRGKGRRLWKHHASVIPASKQIWFAAIGTGIKNDGELKHGNFYQKQIAATIAHLFGLQFSPENANVGKPLLEILK